MPRKSSLYNTHIGNKAIYTCKKTKHEQYWEARSCGTHCVDSDLYTSQLNMFDECNHSTLLANDIEDNSPIYCGHNAANVGEY